MKYIQINKFNRIIAWTSDESNPDPNVWLNSPWNDEIPDNFDDYLFINNELIYDPRDLPPIPFSAEEVLSAIFTAQPEMFNSLPDSALEHMAQYIDEWKINKNYIINDKCSYNERAYRCLQSHISQEDWEPDSAISLWARIIASEDPNNPLPWEQPDSTNPYMNGDRVTHNGHIWESNVDNNVWEPGVYGWTQID